MNKDNLKTINSTPRLLIVDDELLIRKILYKYLNKKEYIVDTVEDGSKALDFLKKNRYDLVLTDLKMPNMGGRELLQIMSTSYPDIPKIVLTGHGTNDDIIVALQTGAYDFLTKPITDFQILEHSIDRAIQSKRVNDEKNRYIEQLQQINEVITMLNMGKNTEELFSTLNIILKKSIPFNILALTTINKNDTSLTSVKLVASDSHITIKEGNSFEVNESTLKEASDKRQVIIINDLNDYLKKHSNSKTTSILLNEGMQSSLIMPLIVNNQTRGYLIFAAKTANVFKNEHISFLESIVGNISLSIQRRELLYEIEQHSKNLENLVELRTREVLKTQKTTVFALSSLAETRDPETGFHLERMRSYSVLMTQLLKYVGYNREITNQYIRDLYDSSILHDIGKVGIPDGILLKDGFLSEKEFEIMKRHTTIGYDALKAASKDLGSDSFLNMAMDVALYHHERWDGTGYPNQLKGDEIPLSARIVAIADVYDALTTKRPYKEAYSHEKSCDIMAAENDKFDPELIKIFLSNSSEFTKIKSQFNENKG